MADRAHEQASDVGKSSWDDKTGAKVDFLRQPKHYPDNPREVRVIETHYAWVFLTGQFVYKFKKPVKLGAVDFRRLAARRDNCTLELQLNSRLAGDTYLDVIPLTLGRDGQLAIDGPGQPVEWLLRMRELPKERMMDIAARAGTITAVDLDAVVRKLVSFYRSAPISEESASQFRRRLESQLTQAHDELRRPKFDLNARLIAKLADAQLGFLHGNPDMFEVRLANHRVREVHGDLKPEHVYLGPDPQIIDCLEFSRELRTMDCVEEIAFLAMECAGLGAHDIARRLLRRYQELSGDRPPVALIRFYLSQRATIRAMLAVWHLEDAMVADAERWVRAAGRYARKAYHYLRQARGLVAAGS